MKTINQLLKELDTIKSYIQNWSDLNNVSKVERDIVKRYISELYSSIHEVNPSKQIVQTSLFDTPVIDYTAPETHPICEPEPEPVPQHEVEPAYEPDLVCVKLEEQDEIHRKNMINDMLIDSLYGDDDKGADFSINIETIIDNAPELESRMSDVSFAESEFKIEIQPATEEVVKEIGTKRVLGDVIGNSTGMLNESFGAPRKDMATKIASGTGNDLHAAIGINDRYMLIRELFNGDIDAYDTALDTLNKFTDFDDCMIHIQENYHWKPNSEGVKLLINLISRKLN